MLFDHGGTILAAAKELGCSPENILDFSASINPLGLSTSVRKACIEALDQAVHYPDPYSTNLTDALAEKHRVPASCIVPANGSTALIHLIPAILDGSSAMIVAPAFSEYSHALARHHWKTSYHLLKPENRFELDLHMLGAALKKESPDVLYLCNPGNPSGTLYIRNTINKVLDCCIKNKALLVLDEAFMDFCGEKNSSKIDVVQSGCGIVLRSLTKFYSMAGLRLGCAITSPGLAQKLRNAIPPWDVNVVAQNAGIAALANRKYESDTLDFVNSERTWMVNTLASIRGMKIFPSSANYILIELPTGSTSTLLQEKMFRNQNILIRDCSNFVGLDSRFIRVAIRTRGENERLITALEEEISTS